MNRGLIIPKSIIKYIGKNLELLLNKKGHYFAEDFPNLPNYFKISYNRITPTSQKKKECLQREDQAYSGNNYKIEQAITVPVIFNYLFQGYLIMIVYFITLMMNIFFKLSLEKN